jgi:hypothetical protein
MCCKSSTQFLGTIDPLAIKVMLPAAARAQGCDVRTHRGRTIVENPAVGIPVPLPEMAENEPLTQFMTEYLCRILQVEGFMADQSQLVSRDWKPTPSEET